jgi:hypothetical protein
MDERIEKKKQTYDALTLWNVILVSNKMEQTFNI